MSAVKFQSPSYKLFEPDYHPQKPIIVGLDDRLDSPETIALRYEEAARVADGGDPRGDLSPRILDMAAYGKAAPLPSMPGYESSRYAEPAYDQYGAQPFAQSQADKFAQLNQQAFATNNAAVAQFMPGAVVVLSCHPSSGMLGTKVFLKISSQYDLFSFASSVPYLYLQFGSEKCPLQDVTRESQDGNGFVYSCNADAPQLLVTGCAGSNVPLSLLIEGAAGDEISRTVAGTFHYLEGSGDDITRADKLSKHDPHLADHGVSPKGSEPQTLASDAGTNNYEDQSQQGQYANPAAYSQGTGDMISTYRSSSFAEPSYHRRTAHGWSGFHGTLGSTRSPGLDSLSARSSLAALPIPSSNGNGAPQLVRTSTIANPGNGGAYHHVSLYSNKAVLKINGKLESMAEKWTSEEWSNRRRIVMFRRSQTGSTITASFRPVAVNERPPNSICISCIWWAEKSECYVTSVDTIHLLEQLVAAPNRFSVEEKNRIRRNLEGFHPLTVSKAKADSEEFFKIIMAFPNPKPRNIEKDVKVFPWKVLESALKKIIGKYSANPSSSTLPPSSMMTPAPYATLPTPPGNGMSSSNQPSGDPHSQYSSHHDSIPSPRSLSGSQPSWTPYTTAPTYPPAPTRVLSPSLRHPSPHHPPPIRLNTNPLPAVTTYDTRAVTTAGYATGLHTPISHPPSTTTPPRWDSTPASYSDGYQSLSVHHTQSAQPVYSSAAYGDGGARV